MPWRRKWHPTPVLLPGESHGRRSLVGYSPWSHKESDTTEQLHFHFSLSCVGEGDGSHSSVLAWRIPGTGEPGGLPSMGSHRVGHEWSDLAAAAAYCIMPYTRNLYNVVNQLYLKFLKSTEKTKKKRSQGTNILANFSALSQEGTADMNVLKGTLSVTPRVFFRLEVWY